MQPTEPSNDNVVGHDRTRDSLLRLPAVIKRTGLSRATIYRKERVGLFPPRVALGGNMVAWYESDIGRWVAAPTCWCEAA